MTLLPWRCAWVVFLLTGCLHAPAEPATPQPDEPTVAAPGNLFSASDCSRILLRQPYLYDTNPAEAPSGWEAPDKERSYVRLIVWSCETTGLGAFERPVTMLWEIASNAHFPRECQEGARGDAYYVVNILVDDPDVHASLAGHGLPVHEATFHAAPGADGTTWTWSWTAEESSTVELHPAPHTAGNSAPYRRLLWKTPNGTAWMDVDRSAFPDTYWPAVASGTFGAPHVFGFQERFVGQAGVEYAAGFSARIHHGGVDCS